MTTAETRCYAKRVGQVVQSMFKNHSWLFMEHAMSKWLELPTP